MTNFTTRTQGLGRMKPLNLNINGNSINEGGVKVDQRHLRRMVQRNRGSSLLPSRLPLNHSKSSNKALQITEYTNAPMT